MTGYALIYLLLQEIEKLRAEIRILKDKQDNKE